MHCTSEVVGEVVDYEIARRATIGAWETLIGPISDRCYKRTQDVVLVETKVFPEQCKTSRGFSIQGCRIEGVRPDGVTVVYIYVLSEGPSYEKLDIAVHEYVHEVADCEGGNGDQYHLDARLWIDYGPETVEAYGCAGL